MLLLREYSDRNLTAVTSVDAICNVHFRDSLSLLRYPEVSSAASLVDVGSGAGFPGIPLAIAQPQSRFTLLESNRRKCAFLEEAMKATGVENISIVPERAEIAASGALRDHFDVALARAVGSLPVSLELALPLVSPGGFAVLQRGEILEGEETVGAAVASRLGAVIDRVIPVKPYPDARNLHIWFIQKKESTPEGFPRRPGMAKKRPLGS